MLTVGHREAVPRTVNSQCGCQLWPGSLLQSLICDTRVESWQIAWPVTHWSHYGLEDVTSSQAALQIQNMCGSPMGSGEYCGAVRPRNIRVYM